MQAIFTPRHELGRTRFMVTQIGIGDLADRNVPLEECVKTVRRAMDAGLNLIDTAPAYEEGYSEQIVGHALRGRRDGMFVIDKIDELHDPVEPQIDQSLKRLEMDYTDLFVFHTCSHMEDWRRITAPGAGMDQLDECRRKGKTRFRGISSHNPEVLVAAIESGLCDVVMFPIGPYADSRYEQVVLPLAHERNVGTVCFKTYGAGKLLGDTTGYNRPLANRPRGKISSGGQDDSAPTLPHLTVDECLHYTLTVGPHVALLGLSFPNEQDAAFAAYQRFHPLSQSELHDIRAKAEEAVRGKGEVWWNPVE